MLCRACFLKSFERRIHTNSPRDRALDKTEKIVVGFSGGKDSLTILDILHTRQQRIYGAPPISAVTIDEGITGYRGETLDLAKKFCGERGIPHVVLEFKEIFGKTLNEMVTIGEVVDPDTKACTYCGVLRRKLLNDFAFQIGATKLVTGHNLDDHVQTFLLNLLRGDVMRVFKWNWVQDEEEQPFTPKIQPLFNVPARDIVLYLYYRHLPLQEIPCPYSQSQPILRGKVQRFLNSVAQNSPEMKYNLLYSMEEIQKVGNCAEKPVFEVNHCSACEGPTNAPRIKCKACELLDRLGVDPLDYRYSTLFNKYENLWESPNPLL
jgi:uncharacterized protein (TIGR00269 family)